VEEYEMETSEINDTNGNKEKKGDIKTKRIIYYILGTLEVLLGFRLIFKVLGANTESTFVSIIYSVTSVFIAPFTGIFRTAKTAGIETQSVLEPALIIAMLVYVLLAWGIVRLIDIIKNRNESETL